MPKHLRIHVQAAIFGENSGICKTGTQQPLPSAAEFGNFWLKACTEMQRKEYEIESRKIALCESCLYRSILTCMC
eukprot:SAG25_NODE_250_length_11019_cov_7.950092_16_plen_75_part_00